MKQSTFKNILLLLALMLPLSAVYSQTPTDSTTIHLSWLKRMQLRNAQKVKEGTLLITPVIGPGYTPEMGFSIAGGALMSIRTDKSDSLLQRSSFPITIGMSTGGAFFVSSKMTTFWMHDKLRINADIWFKSMSDNYFGIGYDNGRNVPKSDSTTAFKRLWFQVNPQVFWKLKPGLYVGGALDVNYTQGSDPSAGVAADPNYIQFNDRPFNTGLGAHVMYDTRDIPVNAWKGSYLLAQAMIYGHYLGGQNNYQVLNIDARHYIQVFKPGQTLAIQLRGRFASGDVSYGEMSQLGTPFDLRGYLWGQYRDRNMIFGIAEYRHSFYKSDGKRSRFGAVGWVGAGSIAPDMRFDQWLPNGGIGLRIEAQPRMAIRLDYGIGKHSSGFYFNFNEAF